MTEFEREGKLTIRVGDTVRVAGSTITTEGITWKDQGWSKGRVLKLVPSRKYGVAAEVTHPRRAGTRVVDAARLTRRKGS